MFFRSDRLDSVLRSPPPAPPPTPVSPSDTCVGRHRTLYVRRTVPIEPPTRHETSRPQPLSTRQDRARPAVQGLRAPVTAAPPAPALTRPAPAANGPARGQQRTNSSRKGRPACPQRAKDRVPCIEVKPCPMYYRQVWIKRTSPDASAQ